MVNQNDIAIYGPLRHHETLNSMRQAEVITQLQNIFDAAFPEPVVSPAAISAQDVPQSDALTHISLMVAVEKSFGVRFRVGEFANRNVKCQTKR